MMGGRQVSAPDFDRAYDRIKDQFQRVQDGTLPVEEVVNELAERTTDTDTRLTRNKGITITIGGGIMGLGALLGYAGNFIASRDAELADRIHRQYELKQEKARVDDLENFKRHATKEHAAIKSKIEKVERDVVEGLTNIRLSIDEAHPRVRQRVPRARMMR